MTEGVAQFAIYLASDAAADVTGSAQLIVGANAEERQRAAWQGE